MPSVENKLSLWGGVAVACSGLFWIMPGVNGIAAMAGIAALTLIIARLGFSRGFLSAFIGIACALSICSLTKGYQAGFVSILIYMLAVIAPAFMMGWASRNFAAPGTTVSYGLMPPGILLVLFLLIYPEMIKNLPSLIADIDHAVRPIIEANPALEGLIEKQYAPADGSLDRFLGEFGRMIEFLTKIVPSIIVLGSLGMLIAGLAIAGSIASRLKIMLPRFRPFHLWRASGWWLMPTILGLIPVVFIKADFWFYLGLNLLIVTGHVYAVVGLAIVEAFFRRAMIPVPIRVIFYVILLLSSLFALIFLAILGLADNRFNFARENTVDKDD
jgi:hypothetical protein